MSDVFRKSLTLVALVVAFAFVTTDSVLAQVEGTEFASALEIPAANDGEGFAVFEADTGNVYFSVGAGVQGFGIRGLDGAVIIENVITDTAIGLQQVTGHSVAGLTFNPAGFPPSVYNVGNFLPPGPSIQTAADFAAAFPNAETVSNTGFEARVSVIPALMLLPAVCVPEPGSFSLFGLTALWAVTHRRRQRTSID